MIPALLGMPWDIGRSGRKLGIATYDWKEEHLPIFRWHPRDSRDKDALLFKLERDLWYAREMK